MLSVGRRFGDLSADDETFEGFTLPFSGFADLCSEIPNLLDGVEYGGLGFDETPVVCELVDNVGGLCAETVRILVDAVKMESRFLWRAWQDVFFKVIVTELTHDYSAKVGPTAGIERTSATAVQFFSQRVAASCSVDFPAF